MQATPSVKQGDSIPRQLLLLSFLHRDSLSAELVRMGWRVIGARRAEDIAQRYMTMGGGVLMLDSRGAVFDALKAVEATADVVRQVGGALVLVLDRDDAELGASFANAGVTHLLTAPWTEPELRTAVIMAARATDHMTPLSTLSGNAWRANLQSGRIEFGTELAERLGAPLDMDARTAWKHLPRSQWRPALRAAHRLQSDNQHAVFVQTIAGETVVHHMSRHGDLIFGEAEWTASPKQLAGRGKDALTGLVDVNAARVIAASHLAAWSANATWSMLLVEIGNIAQVNDRDGRDRGDDYLRASARALERFARQEFGLDAAVARIDGSRFAVLPPFGVREERLNAELPALMHMLREAVAGDDAIRLRLSVVEPRVGEDFSAILRRAARRLSRRMYPRVALDVERALTDGEIGVLFQPQFDFATDRLVGAEALARWNHPSLGSLGGATLMTAAREETTAVSEYIWRRALTDMRSWTGGLKDIRVGLNATAADLARHDFASFFLRLLQENDIAPTRVTVEVTEGAIIANIDAAAKALATLRAAGICVALDDFGTGYSGLSWLKSLPVDYIKIDSGFSQDATGTDRDRTVIRAVIGLAQQLGLDVIAEGIERDEQRAELATMGCKSWQGFLRSGAVTSEKLAYFAI